MRIGVITGEYPPDQGGVGDFTDQLGRALADLGHEVHVITGRPWSEDRGSQRGQVTAHRVVDGWGWRCWTKVLALAQELALDALDVQYQAAAYGMHPAVNFVPRTQTRPPVLVTFHDLKVPYLFPKAGPLRWRVVRTLARRADAVIATNREDYLRLEDEIAPHRLNLIPIGSNIDASPPAAYDRDAERARWGVEPQDLLLAYFGFLNESKGVEELITAVGLTLKGGLPAHLVMIGGRVGSSDPTNRAYAERVDQLIADLGLSDRVHWTSYVTSEQVSAALLASDLCVLPYQDGVSFRRGTLHACLAHGRAIITTRPVVPLLEVRNRENMLLVEPQNPEGLARAVAEVARDPNLRAQLQRGAGTLAAEFTWERIARRTETLLRKLLDAS
jgi:glycosyltransferase involved in cell wall biosynthesis